MACANSSNHARSAKVWTTLVRLHQILANAPHPASMHARRRRGRTAYATGIAAEEAACAALIADGWTIHGRRLRTKAGEVDAVAEKAGVLSIIEVKSRPTLAAAAIALSIRQQCRLVNACEIILGEHPEWGVNGVRFDILVVDPAGTVRRIADAFRLGDQAR
jgi:putative endonuclease